MTNTIYSGENSELYEQSYPYVYAGIRKTDEKVYIGARYAHINAKRSVKDDFGQHYFTSSEKVEFNEFDWEILYISNNSKDLDDVFIFEAELINEHWGKPYLLNGYNPKSGNFNRAGKEPWNKGKTKENDLVISQISESLKRYYANPENAEKIVEMNRKISDWYINPENAEMIVEKGRNHSEWWANPQNEEKIAEMKLKNSTARKEWWANPENEEAIERRNKNSSEWWANPENTEKIKEIGQKVSAAQKERYANPEELIKTSVAIKKWWSNPQNAEKVEERNKKKKGKSQKQLTCPHCGKSGGNSLMTRYHFDKCKNK
jgi:hypothetical protein